MFKPDDQLNLTEQELKEEITRILKANNPNAPQNIVRYNFKERAFKLIPHVEQLAVHFQIDGNLILKDSDDARKQTLKSKSDMMSRENSQEQEEAAEKAAEKAAEQTAKAGGDDDEDEEKKASGKSGKEKKLTNQFNFSERASQTFNNPSREHATMTEPPPRINFSSNATQWEIFDAYIEDFEQQVRKLYFIIFFDIFKSEKINCFFLSNSKKIKRRSRRRRLTKAKKPK